MSQIVGVGERRRYPRVKFENVVRVAGKDKKKQNAVGRDISFVGCSFYVDESTKFHKDGRVEVELNLPKHFVDTIFDSRCRLKGRIAREVDKTDAGSEQEKCVAVEFEKDIRDVVRRIYRFRRIKFLFFRFQYHQWKTGGWK
jgi:hypothetical protein